MVDGFKFSITVHYIELSYYCTNAATYYIIHSCLVILCKYLINYMYLLFIYYVYYTLIIPILSYMPVV